MEIKRERTLFFSFKDVEFIPMEIEIHRWFMGLGIVEDQLTVIDLHFYTKQIVAKFKTQELFEKFFHKYAKGIPFEKHGKLFIIPVYIAGNPWKKIQVKYVPDELDFRYIHSAFEQYGEIRTIEWEKPGFDLLKAKRDRLNVEMMVIKNIPLFFSIMGMRLAVSYSGQKKTCGRCDSEEHEARHCEGGRKTYSQAAATNPAVTLAIETLKEIVRDSDTVNMKDYNEDREEDEFETTDSDEEEWKQQKKKREKWIEGRGKERLNEQTKRI